MAGERLAAVREWLGRRAKVELELDLDLIDSRVIDSLSYTNFILFLEELVGRTIPIDATTIAAVRTLRSIRDTLLDEQP